MCLLLFYINPAATAKEFYLVLISVRDEIYNRPTKNAHVWDSNPNVIGGVDLYPGKEGGTWLAMNKKGMIGALLNILQPDSEILPQKKGRGFLVVDFVTGDKECIDYLLKISKEKKDYNGFLLVTLDLRSFREPQMGYFTNASSTAPSLLSPGIHAFGNSCVIESQWPKTAEAKEKFAEIVAKHTSSSSKDSLVSS